MFKMRLSFISINVENNNFEHTSYFINWKQIREI